MNMKKKILKTYRKPSLQRLDCMWMKFENICLTTSSDPEIDDVDEEDWDEI